MHAYSQSVANKTIYFRDGALWERAKELAGKEGLSAVIQDALAKYVERKDLEAKGIQPYRLHTGRYDASRHEFGAIERIAFIGRELVADELLVPNRDPDPETPYEPVAFGAYQTKGRRIILTRGEAGYGEIITSYAMFPSVRELRDSDTLADLDPVDRARFLDRVSEQLGEDWSVWID
jgi:hypothetical protein